jgi:hypothetical protein
MAVAGISGIDEAIEIYGEFVQQLSVEWALVVLVLRNGPQRHGVEARAIQRLRSEIDDSVAIAIHLRPPLVKIVIRLRRGIPAGIIVVHSPSRQWSQQARLNQTKPGQAKPNQAKSIIQAN